ncbi:hypothetical protein [Pseudomonas putida]|uniref:hypothetical protein n=1 Tax=Pseudomonas putida TaxID=303 RepID=UPI003B283013
MTSGGVTLLPEYAQRLCPAGVVYVPLSGQSPTIELALAHHPDNQTAALEAFRQVFWE